jgi:hypothetical protein
VKQHDTLYFVGDFCLGSPRYVTEHRGQLACKTIHFIEGNHDKTPRKLQHLFASWSLFAEVHVGNRTSCFATMLCGYGRIMLAAAWHLYGHSHSNLPDVPLALSYGYWRRFRRFPPWHFNESRYDYCLGCNPQGASTRRCAAVVELTRHPQQGTAEIPEVYGGQPSCFQRFASSCFPA